MKKSFKKICAMLPLLSTLLWGAAPIIAGGVLLTSCDRFGELFDDGEEDGEDPDGGGGQLEDPTIPGHDTSDGEAPYCRFKSDTLYLPATQEEPIFLEFETNMYSGYYILEKYKNFIDSAGMAQQEPDLILRIPQDNIFPEQEPILLDFYNNHTIQPKTDHLLVYCRRNEKDSLVAKLPVVQEVGAYITPKIVQTDLNSVSIELTPYNGATRYSLYISQDSIPLSYMIWEVNNGTDSYFSTTQPISGKYVHVENNLQDATGYYAYIMAYNENSNGAGITVIPFATTMRTSDDDLVMEIALNPLNNFTAYLPLEGNIKGVIDWGDGNTESVDTYIGTSGSLKHQYNNITSVTTQQIRFRGTADHLTSKSTSYKDYICNSLTGIVQWGNCNLKSICFKEVKTLKTLPEDTRGALANVENLDECFYNCTALETLPEGLFAYVSKVRDFNYTFYKCSSLRSVPADLFAAAKDAASFTYTFYGCSALTSVPEDLFAQNTEVSSMNETFAFCASLQSIPAGLFRNNTNLRTLKSTFTHCTSLQTIPQGLFANCSRVSTLGEVFYPGYNSASGTFSDCTALESIPGDLFSAMTELEVAPGIFDGCTALKAIPENLFAQNTKLRQIDFAFSGCKSLTSIPTGLFDNARMIQTARNVFSYDTSLSGESPYTLIDGNKVHLYERGGYPNYFLEISDASSAFENCTGLSDYEQMPNNWK